MTQFREFTLSTGKIIFGGKNSSNNDELVEAANPKDILVHTAAPGSPFCNLGEKPSKDEIKEAATFCASKSQVWRDNKKDTIIHVFQKSDMYKDKKMKDGTWGVRKMKKIKIKKGKILEKVK